MLAEEHHGARAGQQVAELRFAVMAVGEGGDAKAAGRQVQKDRIAHGRAVAGRIDADLFVHQHVDVLGDVRRGLPAVRVDADGPDMDLVAPMRLEHLPHPFAGNQHAANVMIGEQGGMGERMVVAGSPEDDRRRARNLRKDQGLADDAGNRAGGAPQMAVVVHAIADAQPIEPGAQVEEHAHMAARLLRPAQEAPDDASRVAIERQPAVGVALFVEEVQGGSVRRRVGTSSHRLSEPRIRKDSASSGCRRTWRVLERRGRGPFVGRRSPFAAMLATCGR